MKNWIVFSLVGLMALPVAFANDETTEAAAEESIIVEGVEGTDAEGPLFHDEDLRPRPRPRPRPPGPHPRPPRTAWMCLARDLVRNGFRYVDYDLAWARHGALRECQYRSPVGRCYLVGCERY